VLPLLEEPPAGRRHAPGAAAGRTPDGAARLVRPPAERAAVVAGVGAEGGVTARSGGRGTFHSVRMGLERWVLKGLSFQG
jgi:hypothetical protein